MERTAKLARRCSPAHRNCSPFHCEMVESYRWARQADLDALEASTGLYATEVREYRRDVPALTFKRWLTEGACREARAA